MSWISWFLAFRVRPKFLVNIPQALEVNPGCHKRISDMNLSPVYKNLFTTSFIWYVWNKILPDKGISLERIFNPKLFNVLLAFCSLINSNLSLSHIANLEKKALVFLYLSLKPWGFYFLFFLLFKQYNIINNINL